MDFSWPPAIRRRKKRKENNKLINFRVSRDYLQTSRKSRVLRANYANGRSNVWVSKTKDIEGDTSSYFFIRNYSHESLLPLICPRTLNPNPWLSLIILIVLGCRITSSDCSRLLFCIFWVCESVWVLVTCSISLLLFCIKLAILLWRFSKLSFEVHRIHAMKSFNGLVEAFLNIFFAKNKVRIFSRV